MPTIRTCGGLSLGWKGEISVSLKSFSNNHIDVNIEDNEVRAILRMTGFYRAPEAQKGSGT